MCTVGKEESREIESRGNDQEKEQGSRRFADDGDKSPAVARRPTCRIDPHSRQVRGVYRDPLYRAINAWSW